MDCGLVDRSADGRGTIRNLFGSSEWQSMDSYFVIMLLSGPAMTAPNLASPNIPQLHIERTSASYPCTTFPYLSTVHPAALGQTLGAGLQTGLTAALHTP